MTTKGALASEDTLLHVVVADATSSTYDGLRVFAHPSVLRSRKLQAASLVSILLSREGSSTAVSLVADVWPRSTLDVQELCMPAALLPDPTTSWRAILVNGQGKKSAASPRLASKVELAIDDDQDIEEEKSYMLKALAREHLIKAKYVEAGSTFFIDFQSESFKVHVVAVTSAEREGQSDSGSTTYQVSRRLSVLLPRRLSKHKSANGTHSSGILQKERAYATLGGLDSQIEELRKLVEMPLRRPDIFKRYGLQPPRGLLLFGPPGTGKTTLAYSAAKACLPVSSIETISGPELTSSLHGGTERALRKVFDRARKNAPSVVIIDEIDALAPRRDGDAEGPGGEVEKRVVATLLTLMDGLGNEDDEQARIVVIAATNRPNAIDPALRRPGRLDREIEVGIPTSDARLAILRVLLRNVPHSLTDDQLGNIARRTHGYVGADLSALVREAGMHALSRDLTASSDGIDAQMDALAISQTNTHQGLCSDDFLHAQAKIRPSAMREITLELPRVAWKDIAPGKAGLDVQRAVRECVEWPLRHGETMKRLGVEAPRGLLLYGPPGCSKTLIARALASESGLNFVAVKGGELINKYVGESERALREIFRKARAASPSIIFFDEIDGLTTSRGAGGGEGVGDRLITTLLTEMDGVEQLSNVLVVAATNRPDVLDPALLRPGRLDKLLYVGPPDREARRQILAIRTRQMALADDVKLDLIAELTQGCSGAEVVSICQDAGLRAMNEDISATVIRHIHLEAAAQNVRRRITPLMLQRFESWRDQVAM